MTKRHGIIVVAAVILIGIGILGGYFLNGSLGPQKSQSYSGQTNQLEQPKASTDKVSDARNTPAVQAAKKVGPAVVGITTKVYNRDIFNRKVLVGEGVGSGVIFDGQGYIVTNNHVVENAKSVIVSLADGQSTEGPL
jgi:serine protease Do